MLWASNRIFKVKLTNIRILSESGKDMTSQSVRSYRAELQKKNLFQNKMTEMTKKLVCKFFNKGFCKFTNKCKFEHPENKCTEESCRNKACRKRHPKQCRYKENAGDNPLAYTIMIIPRKQ